MGKKTKAEKEAKLAKKLASLKSEDDRIKEMHKVFDEFSNLGLSDQFEEIDQFQKMMLDYIENGTSYTGVIKLPWMKRNLVYRMNNKKRHETIVVLQNADPNKPSGPI
jgi:hypothetical protein